MNKNYPKPWQLKTDFSNKFLKKTSGVELLIILTLQKSRPLPNLIFFQILLFRLYLRKSVNSLIVYPQEK